MKRSRNLQKYVEQAEVEKKKYYEAKEKWLAQRGSS